MRKIATQIQLDQDQYNAVKRIAEDKGWSMAQVIREAIDDLIKKYNQQEVEK